jgi:hypothetical protein
MAEGRDTEKMDDPRHRGVSTDPAMRAGMPMEKMLEEPRPQVALSMSIDEAQIVVGMLQERLTQKRRWGQNHDRRHTPAEWSAILSEQVGKFAQAATHTIEPDFHLDYKPGMPEFERMERLATVVMAVSMAFLETMVAARR